MIPLPNLSLTAWGLIGVAAFAAVQTYRVELVGGQRDRAVLAAERAATALRTTEANYRLAAEQRRSSDLANVQRVQSEQAEISKEITDDYQTRIAALRADFAERVRRATQADSGSASGADMPGVPDAARRADEATRQARLPARDALIASEQAEQLIALQAWVRGVGAIDVNGITPPQPKPQPLEEPASGR